jgi:hypothetical protein
MEEMDREGDLSPSMGGLMSLRELLRRGCISKTTAKPREAINSTIVAELHWIQPIRADGQSLSSTRKSQ